MTTQENLKVPNLSDERIFEQVFRDHYQAMANFALKYLGDPDLAEEVVQEVFSTVWQKADQISVKTNMKSYLYGAVRNFCLNHIKHQKVEQTYVSRSLHAHNAFDISDILEYDELKSKIDEALEELPPKCREIFELSRFEEKKYKEIAEELGISQKTVENQMGKALKHMRTVLKEYLVVIILMLIQN